VLKILFIPAKCLISPLNKNMHPCNEFSFLYGGRNTVFYSASSANDVLAGIFQCTIQVKKMKVQRQDCRVDAALLYNQIL